MKQLFLLLFAFSIHATEIPKLSLSASAAIFKPADELRLKIGVLTLGQTAEKALSENSASMQEVIANLEKEGLSKEDYETGRFSITPTYTPMPTNPPFNWAPSINGYEVNNTVVIHTSKLHLAGKLIDVANKAGANQITDIRFGLHDPKMYWSEALEAASANAVKDATSIARATGVRLVRILSINLDSTHINAPHLDISCLAKSGVGGAIPPIEPGEVSLKANVSIVYEIE